MSKRSAQSLTAQTIAVVTGRHVRTVQKWLTADQLPSRWQTIEGRTARRVTPGALKSFMRKRGIASRVKWFSVGVGAAKRSAKAKATKRRRAG